MIGVRRAGFTLIEMIVVLIIIAVLAGLTAPAMARMVSPHLAEGDAMPVAALFRSARREAVERGLIVALTVDPAGARYRADSIGVGGSGLLSEGPIALDEDVALETDSLRVRFTFRPDGSVFGDTITVRGRSTTSRISVDRWTGAIHIDAR